MTDTDLSPAEEALAKHIIVSCVEADPEFHGSALPDDFNIAHSDWDIRHVFGDGSSYVVEAEAPFTESERVSRGSRSHPPEYKHHEGVVMATFAIDWSDKPLVGDAHIHIETMGGRPSPPDPEPEWRDV